MSATAPVDPPALLRTCARHSTVALVLLGIAAVSTALSGMYMTQLTCDPDATAGMPGYDVCVAPEMQLVPAAFAQSIQYTPQNVYLTTTTTTLTLTWEPPSNTSNLSGYEISCHGCTKSKSPQTVSPTTNTYTITVTSSPTKIMFIQLGARYEGTSTPHSVIFKNVILGAPSSPINLSATPKDTKIMLNWTAPSNNGSSPITGYKVSYIGSNQGSATSISINNATATSWELVGLKNGQEYRISVFAINSYGAGIKSEIMATPRGPPKAPDAPTELTARVGNAQVTLSWTKPMDYGYPVTDYKIEYKATDGTWSVFADGNSSDTDATVTGLTNGQSYSFRVSAINSVNTGPVSSTIYATPISPPAAPTSLSANYGNAKVDLTWTASVATTAAPVTSYVVQHSTDGTNWSIVSDSIDTDTKATATGLTNGQQYHFHVLAKNAAGQSSPSNIVQVTPLTSPSVPRNLAATPGDAQVILTWNEPANTGGTAILSYTVEKSNDGGSTWSPVPDTTNTDTTATATGLTNGQQYHFRVQAINAAGTGPASAIVHATPVATIVPTAPGAPRNLQAAPGNTFVSLVWHVPASTGTAAISSYTVQQSNDGGTTWSTVSDTINTDTIANATGLTNSQPYKFRVNATNSVGTGPASNIVTATPSSSTNIAVPSAPRNLVATPGNTQVILTWNEPTDNGGAIISSYTVQQSNDGGTTWSIVSDPTNTDTTAIATGLTNSQAYKFRVNATNAMGTGPASVVDATPLPPSQLPPLAPSSISGSPGNGQVTISWSAPPDNGSPAVSIYTIQMSDDNQATWKPKVLTGGNTHSAPVRNLINGQQYSFRVNASNSVGPGPASDTITLTPTGPLTAVSTVPGAPTNLATTAGNGQVGISWRAPSDNGGAPITSYQVQYREAGTQSWSTHGTVTSTSATITGLTNDQAYQFHVSAINSVGTGPASNTATATPSAPAVITAPSAPRNLVATPGNTQVILTWIAPTSDGGAPITSYQVQYREAGTQSWSTHGTVTSTSATITGLTNGQQHIFRVNAINSVGTGPASNTATATPSAPAVITTPSAPRNLVATPGNTQVILTWTASTSDGGAPITSYQVQYREAGIRSWNTHGTATSTSATITGLTNDLGYQFRVNATNTAGTGPESNRAYAIPVSAGQQVPQTPPTTPPTPILQTSLPSAPTGLNASAGAGHVVLDWNIPDSSGDAPIYAYLVQYRQAGTALWTEYDRSYDTTANVTGLGNGVQYDFRVSARSSIGTGPTATVSATPLAPVPSTAPSAPGNLTGVTGTDFIRLSWNEPNTGGASITGYVVHYRQYGDAAWTQHGNDTITERSVTFYDLTKGITYEFGINAVNAAGTGPASTIIITMPLNRTSLLLQDLEPAEDMHDAVIGMIVSETGDDADTGIRVRAAALYAVDQFNDRLESLGQNWSVGISIYNDASNASAALDGIADFDAQGIRSIVGPATGQALRAADQYIADHGMLAISYGSSSPDLARSDDLIFRTVADDGGLVTVLGSIMQNDNISRIIPVFPDDSWGAAVNHTLARSLPGLTVQDGVKYPVNAANHTITISQIGQQLHHKTATAILLLGSEGAAGIIDAAAADDRMLATKWYGNVHPAELLDSTIRADFLTRTQYTSAAVHVAPNAINRDIGNNVTGAGITSYAAYDAVSILAGALRAASNMTDTTSVAAEIPYIARTHDAALGNTTLNGHGDLAHAYYEIITVIDGKASRTATYSSAGLILDELALPSKYSTPFGLVSGISGDWNGDGTDDPGTVGITNNGHQLFTLHANGTTPYTVFVGAIGATFQYAPGTLTHITGDWDGDGDTDVGAAGVLLESERMHVTLSANGTDYTTVFRGDVADPDTYVPGSLVIITGDWNGDGADDIGYTGILNSGIHEYILLINGTIYKAGIMGSSADYITNTFVPVTGDWDGDGDTDVGSRGITVTGHQRFLLYIDGTVREDLNVGEYKFYTPGTMRPLVGDWDGDGDDDIGAVGINAAGLQEFTLVANGTDYTPVLFTSIGDARHYQAGKLHALVGDWDGDGDDDIGAVGTGLNGLLYFTLTPYNDSFDSSFVGTIGNALQYLTP